MSYYLILAEKIDYTIDLLYKAIKGKISYFLLSLAIIYPPFIPFELLEYYQAEINSQNQVILEEIDINQENQAVYPVVDKREPKSITSKRLTAYSSTPDQTSGNPFVTASGFRVEDGIVAANCLNFGTKIRIPEIYGDKIFTVRDRLAARMGCEVIDIWFPSRQEAVTFGKKYAKIEIL